MKPSILRGKTFQVFSVRNSVFGILCSEFSVWSSVFGVFCDMDEIHPFTPMVMGDSLISIQSLSHSIITSFNHYIIEAFSLKKG